MGTRVVAVGLVCTGLLFAWVASGCGEEPDDPAPVSQQLDLGARAPFDEPHPRPDQGVPYCGDHICQPNESVLNCCRDCCPRPSRSDDPPIIHDPGWIDPPEPGPWR